MKNILRTLLFLVLLSSAVASLAAGKNLVTGVGPIVSAHNNGDWAGYSALNLVAGASLQPITSATTAFYLTFVGGNEADVSNMVLYQMTARGSFTVAKVIPVTLGAVSNPSILLSNKKTCKTQPVSPSHPCTVKLDVLKQQLSPMTDYWLVVYFTNDSNNQAVYAGTSPLTGGGLSGGYDLANDAGYTAGETLPAVNAGYPYFLTAVATN